MQMCIRDRYQLVQHQLLVRVQLCGVCRVYRGERGVPQRIALLPHLHGVGAVSYTHLLEKENKSFSENHSQIMPCKHLQILSNMV